jgi:hypothetical protein
VFAYFAYFAVDNPGFSGFGLQAFIRVHLSPSVIKTPLDFDWSDFGLHSRSLALIRG